MSDLWFDRLLANVFVHLFRVTTWFKWLVILFVALELLLAGAVLGLWAWEHWLIAAPIGLVCLALIWWRAGETADPDDPPIPLPRRLARTAGWTAVALIALVAAWYLLGFAIRHPDYSVPAAVVLGGVLIYAAWPSKRRDRSGDARLPGPLTGSERERVAQRARERRRRKQTDS